MTRSRKTERLALHHLIHIFNYTFPLPRGRWFLQRLALRYSNLPRWLSHVRIDRGMHMNLDTSQWVDRCVYFNLMEPTIKRAIARYVGVGQTALDIGANIGYFSLLMGARVGSSGTVHAFEPDSGLCERARKDAAANGLGEVIRIHPVAVSNTSGTVRLHLCPGHAELSSIAPGAHAHGISMSVQAVTLDELHAQGKLESPSFIKIDVEGAELPVLIGAEKLIGHSRPVIVAEVDQEQYRLFGVSPSDLVRWSSAQDYRVDFLHPWKGLHNITPSMADLLPHGDLLLVPE